MTDASEYGPLGPGQEPVKDPIKGLRGVMSGVLIAEAITLGLVLTVISKFGDLWQPANIWFVSLVAVAHVVAAFLQRFIWAIWLNIVLQVVALGGFFIHWSMGAVVIMFILVWIFVFYLRNVIIERKKRGLLTTQHT